MGETFYLTQNYQNKIVSYFRAKKGRLGNGAPSGEDKDESK